LPQVINPFVLYACLVLGGVGVCVALPRRGINPQQIGALIAGAAAGLLILVLTMGALGAGEGLPNLAFYVFGLIALGASLRVITHPRPVYSAIYFILSILASSGLYVTLSAEFMAFALIIIYAGAILITYLFVIMLATQAPTEDREQYLEGYDRQAREPITATVAGFVLLAVLTTMLFGGLPGVPAGRFADSETETLASLPKRVHRVLREAEVIEPDEIVLVENGVARLDAERRTATVIDGDGTPREVTWAEGVLGATNTESIGHSLLVDHPGAIEIAGVILLMAMLGAVVLARKKVDLDEAAKAAQVGHLSAGEAA
jgi:NADH-quinone oxidoreductase subunit J